MGETYMIRKSLKLEFNSLIIQWNALSNQLNPMLLLPGFIQAHKNKSTKL